MTLRAGDGTRTRNHLLGRRGLCQLSYSCKYARVELNHLPDAYKASALTDELLAYESVCRIMPVRIPSLIVLHAPSRTRTYNLLVKSQLLYQLSYKGVNTMLRVGLEPTSFWRGILSPLCLPISPSEQYSCNIHRCTSVVKCARRDLNP